MIKINNNGLSIIGTVKECNEEMNELRQLYGNITIEDLLIKLKEKWKR